MKRSSRFIKRRLALILVLLFSIESFAAVVGDNDGAAFITKAEFDSMKNDFQSQLDRYNSSLDNKIDGAIASYLNGLKITKNITLENIVSSYSDIIWKRRWEIKATERKWTNASTYTDSSGWMVPKFQKMIPLRNISHQIFFGCARQDGAASIMLQGNWEFPNDSNAAYEGVPCLYFHVGYPSVNGRMVLCTQPDSRTDASTADGNVILALSPLFDWRAYAANDPQYPLRYNATTNTWGLWGYIGRTDSYAPLPEGYGGHDWLVVNTPTNGQIINAQVTSLFGNGTSTLLRWVLQRDDRTLSIIESAGNEPSMSLLNTMPTTLDSIQSGTNYFAGGRVRYKTSQAEYNDLNATLRHLMLGKDQDLEVNIMRRDKSQIRGSEYQRLTEFSPRETLTLLVNKVAIGNPRVPWNGTVGAQYCQYSTPVALPLSLPLYERVAFKTLCSGQFFDGTTPLRFGDGLPIVKNLLANGDLTITFDWEVSRSLDAIGVGDIYKKIDIDIKKTDFLTDDGSWLSGSCNGVDTTLHNFTLSPQGTTNKATIEITNLKQGDNLYMRIAPTTTDGGYKAKISNMTIVLHQTS